MPASASADVSTGIIKAVIPAAGLGTRLRPLSSACPKELLPVGRQPVLGYVVEELRGAGITRVLFIISERKTQIRDFFGTTYTGGDASRPPLYCNYRVQKEQRGSGDAVLQAAEWVGADPFVVAFGDCLIDAPDPAGPLRRMIATHQQQNAAATVLVETVDPEKVSRYGVVDPIDPVGEHPAEPFALGDIVEKPPRERAPSRLVVAARFVLSASIFRHLQQSPPDVRGEWNLPDSVRQMRHERGGLWAVPLRAEEYRRDIGNFESYYAAFLRAALRDPEFGASVRDVLTAEINRAGSA